MPLSAHGLPAAPGKPTNSNTENNQDSSASQSSNRDENSTDAGSDIDSILDSNMELVRSVNGTTTDETITTADGKQIFLNAQVNTESV